MPSLIQRGPTHDIPYVDIRLDDDVLIFRGAPHEAGGAPLSGRLCLCITENITVKGIVMVLQGIKRLQWHERAPPPVSGLMTANSKTIKHEEIFYEKKWNFTPSDHPFTMAPKNYEYPFNDTLHGDLPESVEGLGASHIVYRIKARIYRGRLQHDITAKKHLRVVRTLTPGALELSQTMSVENLWPNKVEYSISIPTKAVVFGTSIPVDIVLVPLLKGLTIGKVICQLKETHTLSCPQKASTKTDTRHILSQTFENGEMEEGEGSDEDLGKWRLHDRVILPKSLHACVQDCEIASIKIKHKLKFTIQLHNPDGHMSELRASLPVMLFISPQYLMNENNRIPSNAAIDEESTLVNAPPRYDEHYLDRLYDGISYDHETPLPSGANTPRILSRSNSTEDLSALANPATSPLRIPDANSRHWYRGSRSVGATPVATPSVGSPPLPSNVGGDEVGDYFSHGNNVPQSTNGSRPPSPHPRSEQSTRTSSPDNETVNLTELSRVPSYTTAMRANPRNLGDTTELPGYDQGNYRSAPVSPQLSPALNHTARPWAPVRSNTGGILGRRSDRHHRASSELTRNHHSHHNLHSLGDLLESAVLR